MIDLHRQNDGMSGLEICIAWPPDSGLLRQASLRQKHTVFHFCTNNRALTFEYMLLLFELPRVAVKLVQIMGEVIFPIAAYHEVHGFVPASVLQLGPSPIPFIYSYIQ